MLQLALATAEDPRSPGRPLEADLPGTAATYRMLARLLSLSDGDHSALEAELCSSKGVTLDTLRLPDRISTKFVIDIVSGTSAVASTVYSSARPWQITRAWTL